MYKIEFANTASKELARISRQNAKFYQRLIFVIDSLSRDPFQGKPLKGHLQGDFSLRVWDYRIIYSIHKDKLIVYIIDVGHRREVYRKKISV